MDNAIDTNRVLVTVKKAAELASVSKRTIYHWMDAHKVEFAYTASGTRRIFLDTLFRSTRYASQA